MFKIGDVVWLNSGGPAMTVIQDSKKGVCICGWHDNNLNHNESDFPDVCLRTTDPDKQ